MLTNGYGRVRLYGRTRLNPETGCVEWVGAKNDMGYGQHVANYQKRYVHRIAHEVFNGPIPEGHYVLHRCDNPACMNPLHLDVGTQTDNMRDAASKGRVSSGDDHWTRQPDRPSKPGPKCMKKKLR